MKYISQCGLGPPRHLLRVAGGCFDYACDGRFEPSIEVMHSADWTEAPCTRAIILQWAPRDLYGCFHWFGPESGIPSESEKADMLGDLPQLFIRARISTRVFLLPCLEKEYTWHILPEKMNFLDCEEEFS